jgi:hypothetical protein
MVWNIRFGSLTAAPAVEYSDSGHEGGRASAKSQKLRRDLIRGAAALPLKADAAVARRRGSQGP